MLSCINPITKGNNMFFCTSYYLLWCMYPNSPANPSQTHTCLWWAMFTSDNTNPHLPVVGYVYIRQYQSTPACGGLCLHQTIPIGYRCIIIVHIYYCLYNGVSCSVVLSPSLPVCPQFSSLPKPDPHLPVGDYNYLQVRLPIR